MSLEKEVAELRETVSELTVAVKENSELLKFLTGKARDGLTAKDDSTKASKPAAAAKEDKEDKKPASRSRSSTKAPKAPTSKEMAEATTKFLDVDDETEYKDRRELVMQIVEKFGVKKMSEIDEGERQSALDMLEAWKAGDDPFADEGGKDDDLA